MSIFIFSSVFVYTHCAENQASFCATEFHFGKGLFYKQTDALVELLKRKYCLRFAYGRKFYYQLRIRHLNVLLKI